MNSKVGGQAHVTGSVAAPVATVAKNPQTTSSTTPTLVRAPSTNGNQDPLSQFKYMELKRMVSKTQKVPEAEILKAVDVPSLIALVDKYGIRVEISS